MPRPRMLRSRSRSRLWLPTLLLVLAPLVACDDSTGLGSCGATSQPCCDGVCGGGLLCQSGVCTTPGRSPVDLKYRTKVDVLFLIDDSTSMEAMAQELRNRFPQFFGVFSELARNSFYADLHLGVVTSDLGAGRGDTPGCAPGGGGRGGKFQAIGKSAAPSCQRPIGADYVQYVFAPIGDGPSNLPPGQSLLQTFTCMASVGSSGCGFEQVLESAYQALKNPPAGFLRDDAVLAVVFLTNEDDCSAPFDSDLFDESQSATYGYFNSYRCTRFGVAHGSPPILFPYSDSGGAFDVTSPAPNPGGKGPGKLWDHHQAIASPDEPAPRRARRPPGAIRRPSGVLTQPELAQRVVGGARLAPERRAIDSHPAQMHRHCAVTAARHHRVLGVRHQLRLAPRDVLLERQADRARVHQQRTAVLPEHLDVRMSAGHHGRRVAGEVALQLVRRRGGQQILHVRARRAVEQEERGVAAERQGERGVEAAHEVELGGAGAITAPVDRLHHDGRLGVGADQRRVEQEIVVVAEDAGDAAIAQHGEDGAGPGPEGGHVAEAHGGVDAQPVDVGKHGRERHLVGVQVGDQGDAHGSNRV